MSTYRKEWPCCGSVTETEAWEPEECPFCTVPPTVLAPSEGAPTKSLVLAAVRSFWQQHTQSNVDRMSLDDLHADVVAQLAPSEGAGKLLAERNACAAFLQGQRYMTLEPFRTYTAEEAWKLVRSSVVALAGMIRSGHHASPLPQVSEQAAQPEQFDVDTCTDVDLLRLYLKRNIAERQRLEALPAEPSPMQMQAALEIIKANAGNAELIWKTASAALASQGEKK